MPTYLCIVCGCFRAIRTELSSCTGDHRAYKTGPVQKQSADSHSRVLPTASPTFCSREEGWCLILLDHSLISCMPAWTWSDGPHLQVLNRFFLSV